MWKQLLLRQRTAAMAAVSAAWTASAVTCSSDDKMTPPELTAYLKRNLAAFRQEFAKSHPNVPTHPIQVSHQTNVVRLSFQSPSSSTDTPVHRFLRAVGTPVEVVPSPTDDTLNYIFTDASGSFQWLPTKSKDNLFVLFKDLPISRTEADAVLAAYTHAYLSHRPVTPKASSEGAIATLQQLGLDVYDSSTSGDLTWDALAGYDEVKREIDDTVVLALQNPSFFENIAKHTRARFESNRPRAILFEGPPGTGKTLSARIIASQAKVPLIHLPVESIVSKWYGESEQKLAKIFDACDQLETGAILFIDEIDALASDRSSGTMHEATRRLLSVLLQKVEGFASSQKVTLIAATNRKQDLDSALLSRFNLTIRYDLPDKATREAVFHRYAKQLTDEDLHQLAAATATWSCRDIKELCEYTERKWASQVLRKQQDSPVPSVEAYVVAVEHYTAKRPATSITSSSVHI
ncbi:hypothetical protein, variant 1 [Aphanomyces astaci]|uniref:AAA+ ATPase domain-containing protein n=2 Tax=Aphanomyces astaci TaxID=112090 RepID=W4FIS3_APHAT|nr:hypothetical protein, variant 1 [Aphanomyces astaci]ETV67412.1 hypothetical protein, variant 1 [Aphanomyces astaci]|eukprot:XP_009843103.1 hypothetical protein, variant 1 [Aphanomyces astaci]